MSPNRGGDGAIRNRAGWLYSAIVNDYALQTEPAHRQGRVQTCNATVKAEAPTNVQKVEEPTANEDEELAFQAFWMGLTEAQQVEFERSAVAEASPFLRKQFNAGGSGRGVFWEATRRCIIRGHFERISQKAPAVPCGPDLCQE